MKNDHKDKDDKLGWLHQVRFEEIKILEEFLKHKKEIKILEIGGGDGFRAKILNDEGFSIVSIDKEPRIPLIFPVKKNENEKLEFPDESFDVIFTCHVLPHVHNLKEIFDEIKRVLKKDGIVIHIVPTSGWSLITNIWHYLFIPKYLLKSIKKRAYGESKTSIETNTEVSNSPRNNLKKLFLHPLGENSSFIHEMILFSKRKWKELFLRNDFKIVTIKRGPYITSGYGVFKFKIISVRKFFAKYFFTSSYCFVLKL